MNNICKKAYSEIRAIGSIKKYFDKPHRRKNRGENMVYNNLVVLVASETILPGDELVFNYHVTY